MAEQQQDQDDELDGITEDEAQRLLADAVQADGPGKDEDSDPDGAEQLGDAGKRALERIKEDRRAAREERDKIREELRQAQEELRKHSDKDKSETQRLQEERDQLKAELTKATSAMRRREFAEEFAPEHASPAQIRAVAKRLSGDTDAELEADARELYALIAPVPAKPTPGRPKERLRGGGGTDDGDEIPDDPRKLAALVNRAR